MVTVIVGPVAVDLDDAMAVHEWLGEKTWGYALFTALGEAIERGEDFPVTAGENLTDPTDGTEWRIELATDEYVFGVDDTGTVSRFWTFYGHTDDEPSPPRLVRPGGGEAGWPWDL